MSTFQSRKLKQLLQILKELFVDLKSGKKALYKLVTLETNCEYLSVELFPSVYND